MKKRILVTIVGQGSIVYIIRTGLLDLMQQFCEPVVAILWDQPDLIEELQKKSFEVHVIPPIAFSNNYLRLRQQMDYWYQRKVLRSPSTDIERNYLLQHYSRNKRLRKRFRLFKENARLLLQGDADNKKIQKERELLLKEPSYSSYTSWLYQLRLDGLFTVTPFLKEVELMAVILRSKQLPVVASIHSFDNITKRGWGSVRFDHYLVWNQFNKEELLRVFHQLEDANITITGAPQFDFHNNLVTKIVLDWKESMGIPTDKKVILYGGGPAALFPNEPQYLRDICDAIEQGQVANAVVLFRPHPLDKIERWQQVIGHKSFVFFDNSPHGTQKFDYTNVTKDDIVKLISVLKNTDVHVNLCSTMTVDGSFFCKPQIGPAYENSNRAKSILLKNMYYQEHFLPIMQLQGVHLAESREALIALLNEALLKPQQLTAACTATTHTILTYTDGKSTARVSSVLKKLFC